MAQEGWSTSSERILSFKKLGRGSNDNESRRGEIHFPGRKIIETPHYVALSSRGAVPHLSQDVMRDHTSINGLYAALEDCKPIATIVLKDSKGLKGFWD